MEDLKKGDLVNKHGEYGIIVALGPASVVVYF